MGLPQQNLGQNLGLYYYCLRSMGGRILRPDSGERAALNTSRCSATFLRSPKLIRPKLKVSRRPRTSKKGVFVRWNQDVTLGHLHAMDGDSGMPEPQRKFLVRFPSGD